ncbi:uncharacterized protein LOC135082632 [Ostrinia nubilalis]|uniref:uncharacterized protein LOC135082632 n=1 Tax=Ostrinia nubilalis TaxID=29057 RepID=UPI0030826A07
MGCMWSSEDANRCMYCNRRRVKNLIFFNGVCEICIRQSSSQQTTTASVSASLFRNHVDDLVLYPRRMSPGPVGGITATSTCVVRQIHTSPSTPSYTASKAKSFQAKPLYGEYRCSCGRFWKSQLSWARAYQICKRCRKPVFAHKQRELRPSDRSQDKENRQEHQREYCQMCQQLGRYCGNYGNNEKRRMKNHYSY